jgi:hypothetical protein
MKLKLVTQPEHELNLRCTSDELLVLRTALGKFSQRDFVRMGLNLKEIEAVVSLHSDLDDLVKVV